MTVYISDFKRSLMDKLSKDFFTEPSQVLLQIAADVTAVLCRSFCCRCDSRALQMV